MSDSQQRLLTTLLSGIPGMLALKNNELRYEFVNPALCTFAGRPPQDIIGMKASDLFSAAEARDIEAADQEVLKTARANVAEYKLTGVDGPRWFETSRSPILDDDGVAVGLLVVALDITKYRQQIEAASGGGGDPEAEHRLIEAEAKLSELLNQLQAAQTKAAEAEKNARSLSVKLGDMEIKVAEAQRKSKQIEELNQKLAEAEKRAQDAESKIKDSENTAGMASQFKTALQKKTAEADKIKTDLLAALKQLEDLRAWAQQAQYQYGELQKLCKSAEQARDKFKAELEQLKATATESESAKTQLESLRGEADTLRAQLDESQGKIAALEDEITKLKTAKKEIADLLKKISPDE